MITIIDYQMGNLGSIVNTYRRLRIEIKIASNPEDLLNARRLILPGVGSFDEGMKKLKSLGYVEILNKIVGEHKVPILGICLGMQLFFNASEEGSEKGLGWIEGSVVHFNRKDLSNREKVPHMGWNTLKIKIKHPLLDEIRQNDRFYFAHSYHALPLMTENIIAETLYGYSFPSIVAHNNIIGVQFHPERSHQAGKNLLKQFIEI